MTIVVRTINTIMVEDVMVFEINVLVLPTIVARSCNG